MKTSKINSELLDQAKNYFQSGKTLDEVHQIVASQAILEEEREAIIYGYKKFRHEREHKSGLKLLLVGATILLSGFLITLGLHYANINFNWIMYAFTVIGSGMALYGLSKMIS